MNTSPSATEEADHMHEHRLTHALGLQHLAVVIALIAAVVLLWPSPAKAADGPDKRAAIVSIVTQWWQADPVVTDELQRLRRQNRKLRKHVSSYGRWVRRQQRTISVMREQMVLGWQVRNAIALAAVAYGQSEAVLLRKADCESGLWPFSRNPTPVYNGEHATGLFQFLPSTYRSTPYARFSIWDPYANSLAAGWMHANGRGGEWACR